MKLITTENMRSFFGDEPVISASVRVTKGCNLRCRHCYANGGACLKNELKTDEMKKVLKDLSEAGCLSVFFTGGEPFLRNDITDIFKTTSDLGMSVMTSTNGILVTEERLKEVKKTNMKLFQISLDSSTKNYHDFIRGEGSFDKAISALRMTSRILGKNIGVGTVLMKNNSKDIGNIMKLATDLGADNFALNILLKSGRANIKLDPTTKEKIEAIRDVFRTFKELKGKIKFTNNTTIPPFLIPPELRDELYEKFCFCSFPYLLAVESDGNVAPCDGFLGLKNFELGNVRKDSINEIWEKSKMMKKIRSIKPADMKGVCAKCIFKESCMGGCRAAAYLEYKDMKMPDPVCQHIYEAGLFPKDCLKS
ncbi:MAG: radical SAM protein [Candidatus Woesearchaeota archaeon]